MVAKMEYLPSLILSVAVFIAVHSPQVESLKCHNSTYWFEPAKQTLGFEGTLEDCTSDLDNINSKAFSGADLCDMLRAGAHLACYVIVMRPMEDLGNVITNNKEGRLVASGCYLGNDKDEFCARLSDPHKHALTGLYMDECEMCDVDECNVKYVRGFSFEKKKDDAAEINKATVVPRSSSADSTSYLRPIYLFFIAIFRFTFV